jgi:hypothetical protein
MHDDELIGGCQVRVFESLQLRRTAELSIGFSTVLCGLYIAETELGLLGTYATIKRVYHNTRLYQHCNANQLSERLKGLVDV